MEANDLIVKGETGRPVIKWGNPRPWDVITVAASALAVTLGAARRP